MSLIKCPECGAILIKEMIERDMCWACGNMIGRRIIGLQFIPDKYFEKMFVGLQNLVDKKYKGVFFLDASEKAINKMKYSAFQGSNKLNGWIIPKDKVEEFNFLFSQSFDLSEWDSYRTSVWAWNDTDMYHCWLYSFKRPIFGETIIE